MIVDMWFKMHARGKASADGFLNRTAKGSPVSTQQVCPGRHSTSMMEQALRHSPDGLLPDDAITTTDRPEIDREYLLPWPNNREQIWNFGRLPAQAMHSALCVSSYPDSRRSSPMNMAPLCDRSCFSWKCKRTLSAQLITGSLPILDGSGRRRRLPKNG